uniref:Uncharacterized protein n=1 Tax=Gopherus evgoodei TaxID=1825980 RepID=A0A8C4YP82_9SAUR
KNPLLQMHGQAGLLPCGCWLAPGPREQTAAFPVCSLGPGTPSKQVSFPSGWLTTKAALPLLELTPPNQLLGVDYIHPD